MNSSKDIDENEIAKSKSLEDRAMEVSESLPGVLVHQVQQESVANSEGEEDGNDDEVIVSYYERFFSVGSVLSFPIQAASPSIYNDNDNNDEKEKEGEFDSYSVGVNPCIIDIADKTKLTINSVSRDPSIRRIKSSTSSLYISTESNPDFLCICPNVSSSVISSLGLEIYGPAQIQLALVTHSDVNDNSTSENITLISHVYSRLPTINIFGNVQLVEDGYASILSEIRAKEALLLQQDQSDTEEDEDIPYQIQDKKQDMIVPKQKVRSVEKISSKKRKLIDEAPAATQTKKQNIQKNDTRVTPTKCNYNASTKDTSSTSKDDKKATSNPASNGDEPKKLTKKQRKKLAKEKAQQLQDTIAKESGTSNETTSAITKVKQSNGGSKKVSLTKERVLKDGLRVRDIIHGSGSSIKSGRKVSITYEGRLQNSNKVFDKNTSMMNPLVFRIGTGEVIKGLERGLDGMKVGGEREIVIPPALGYGKKGSKGGPNGGIPGNATLCFVVQLLKVGGR